MRQGLVCCASMHGFVSSTMFVFGNGCMVSFHQRYGFFSSMAGWFVFINGWFFFISDSPGESLFLSRWFSFINAWFFFINVWFFFINTWFLFTNAWFFVVNAFPTLFLFISERSEGRKRGKWGEQVRRESEDRHYCWYVLCCYMCMLLFLLQRRGKKTRRTQS